MILFLYLFIGLYLLIKFKSYIKLKYTNEIINKDKNISSFQSLFHSLSSCMGTANIIGVSILILTFGPGVIFWMMVQAILGSIYKFFETFYTIKFRSINEKKENISGPMYYLSFVSNYLGIIYSIFLIIVSLTLGNLIQINSIKITFLKTFNFKIIYISIFLAFIIYLSIKDGIKKIVKYTDIIIPLVSIFYLLSCFIILYFQRINILSSIKLIFIDAFKIKSLLGISIYTLFKYGITRGLFSNEAGIGSGSIAFGASFNTNPKKEGLISMLNPIIDTLVVCFISSIVILSNNNLKYNINNPENFIIDIFIEHFGKYGSYIMSISMFFFAFAAILGWYYFGEKGVEFLFKNPLYKKIYLFIFVLFSFLGFYINTNFIYKLTDVSILFLLVPNIIGLFILTKKNIK